MKNFALPFVHFSVYFRLILLNYICFVSLATYAQKNKVSLAFEVSMPDPASHLYHVVLNGSGFKEGIIELNMPAWITGYYQIMNFAANVENFQAFSSDGRALQWKNIGANAWTIYNAKYEPVYHIIFQPKNKIFKFSSKFVLPILHFVRLIIIPFS